MKTHILVILLLFFLTLKAQEKSKDTLFFSINKYYTVSPTLVSNLSDRTYTESIEFGKEQKKRTKTNGYIFL
jgi:hypothetical protein